MKYLKLYESFNDFEKEEINRELYSDVLQDYNSDERKLTTKYKLVERLSSVLNIIESFEDDDVTNTILRNDIKLYGKLFSSDENNEYDITVEEGNVKSHLSSFRKHFKFWTLEFEYKNISMGEFDLKDIHPTILYKIIKTLLSSEFVNNLINGNLFNKINT